MRTLILVTTLLVPLAAAARGRVYTQSNAADANEVLVFDRDADGSLTLHARVATGGRGSGAGLGSQGALAFAGDFLVAVNAGSDDVSVLAVERDCDGGDGLRLVSRTATHGKAPISVAVHGGDVYVLDGGGDGDVAHLRLDRHGALAFVAARPLANAAPSPAEVAVSPGGDTVVVTEKATGCIDTFAAGNGTLGAAVCHASSGQTPFGFAFAPSEVDWLGNRYDRLVVSEAAGGAPGASTVSTYLLAGGAVVPVADAVPTLQTAACWIAIAHGGRHAYSTNTGSGNVTGFALGRGGDLARLASDGDSGDTGSGSKPADATIADGLLYVLDGGTHALSVFGIGHDGSLHAAGSLAGLPAFAAGLLAR